MARTRRFYIDRKIEASKPVELPEKLKNHIVRVLRIRNNSLIRLFDPSGREFIAKLCVNKHNVSAIPLEEVQKPEAREVEIILCQSLPKLRKMDFIIQKATEVGVSTIIPLISSRTVLKHTNLESKMRRWQRIAEEAARQCERKYIPIIENLREFKSLFKNNYAGALKILLTPDAEKRLKDILKKAQDIRKAVVLVGPEGGFETSEIELAQSYEFIPVKLWGNVLRTETAGIIAAGILMYEWN